MLNEKQTEDLQCLLYGYLSREKIPLNDGVSFIIQQLMMILKKYETPQEEAERIFDRMKQMYKMAELVTYEKSR